MYVLWLELPTRAAIFDSLDRLMLSWKDTSRKVALWTRRPSCYQLSPCLCPGSTLWPSCRSEVGCRPPMRCERHLDERERAHATVVVAHIIARYPAAWKTWGLAAEVLRITVDLEHGARATTCDSISQTNVIYHENRKTSYYRSGLWQLASVFVKFRWEASRGLRGLPSSNAAGARQSRKRRLPCEQSAITGLVFVAALHAAVTRRPLCLPGGSSSQFR